MCNLVIFIEDRLRGKLVRLQVDEDRRIDALIEWYVTQFGLPDRYLDLVDIEYELLRVVDNRAFCGPKTLREAGIAEGDRLLLRSRNGVRRSARSRRRVRLPELRIRRPVWWPRPRQSRRAAAGYSRQPGG